MFRLWAKIWKDNHMMKDITIENASKELTRTKKVLAAVEEVSYAFDLGKPIWLEVNIAEFKKSARTRFRRDNFIDELDFDYLEILMIEENEAEE